MNGVCSISLVETNKTTGERGDVLHITLLPPPHCFILYFVVTQWLHQNETVAGTTMGFYCGWKKGPFDIHDFTICQISDWRMFYSCWGYAVTLKYIRLVLLSNPAGDNMTPCMWEADRFSPHVTWLTSFNALTALNTEASAPRPFLPRHNVVAIRALSHMSCTIFLCLY